MQKFLLAALLASFAAVDGVRYSRDTDTDPVTGAQSLYDLPPGDRLENKPGRDGQGLCVFTSIDNAARWQNTQDLIGLRDWMTQHPGGGYPAKVVNVLNAKSPGFKDYVQAEGDAAITLAEWAIRNYRLPCNTYGFGEHYGAIIAHMLNTPYLDDRVAAVLDNNYPDELAWIDRAEWERRIRINGPWTFVLTTSPAPPVPTLRSDR